MLAPCAPRRIVAAGALAFTMLVSAVGSAEADPAGSAAATPKPTPTKNSAPRPKTRAAAKSAPVPPARATPKSAQKVAPKPKPAKTTPPARAKKTTTATKAQRPTAKKAAPRTPAANTAAAKAAAPRTPAPRTPVATKVAVKPVSSPRSERARQVQPRRPQTRRSGKVVYLTFDDGPNRVTTPQVLTLLQRYNAKATFFMVGNQAEGKTALVQQVRAAGHAVGNHTYSHPSLTKLATPQIRQELRRTDALIGQTSCMRPPGGATNEAVASAARSEGKHVSMWSVDTVDWRRPGVQAIAAGMLTTTRSGSVVLMHDGGGPRAQTVQALATVLPRWAAQGYRFETLPSCR